MNIKPLGDRVLVVPAPAEEKIGGIIIPGRRSGHERRRDGPEGWRRGAVWQVQWHRAGV